MFYNSSLLGVWVWSRDSIAPPTVNPHIMHTHKFKKFGTMSHDQMHKNIGGTKPSIRKLAILIFAAIFSHFHAWYFNKLLLQILHHTFHIQSVSSSGLEDYKLSRAFASIRPGRCGGAVHSDALP